MSQWFGQAPIPLVLAVAQVLAAVMPWPDALSSYFQNARDDLGSFSSCWRRVLNGCLGRTAAEKQNLNGLPSHYRRCHL